MSVVSTLLDDHLQTASTLRDQVTRIEAIGRLLVTCLHAGNKVLLCGNGGSAADAQHIAPELVCRFESARRGLPAIALTTDSSGLTAIGNDFGFERVFARQVEALGRPGDMLVAISTSGNSPNVLAAVEAARGLDVTCIGLLGGSGGVIRDRVQHSLVIASNVTARIQECHILVGHIWCALIDAAFSAG